MQIAGNSGILVWTNRVYVGFSDGMVVAFDANTGTERWQPVDLAVEAENNLGGGPQHFDVDTTPVPGYIDDSPVVFVASAEGGLFALDADNGTQVWQNPGVVGTTQLLLWQPKSRAKLASTSPESTSLTSASPESTLLETDENPLPPPRPLLIAATGNSGLWAVDPSDGTVVWRSKLPDGGVAGPTPVAGALLVSASQLGLYLLSPINGRVIDGLHVAEGISALPSVYGQHAFVLTNQGKLTAIHIAAPGGPETAPAYSVLGGGSYERGHW
jgi:outer membrane protein assembly factor BamB